MGNVRPVEPAQVNTISEWDGEADVVVVGYGVAGASAALGATAEGSDVLILERTSGWGGAAALSGGFVYLGGGTPLQKACGFDDTTQAMFDFLMAAMGPGADEAKIRLYCGDSVDHYHWLIENGVHFNPVFHPDPAHEPPDGKSLMYSGGENAWPFNVAITPAPRGHVANRPPSVPANDAGERSGGHWLMRALTDSCADKGVRIAYNIRTDRLIINSSGRVVGVSGFAEGRPVNYRARGGVVLAGGGFTHNDDMMHRFAPEMIRRPGGVVEAHDGQGIRMAQTLGADLGRMDGCEVWSTAIAPELLAKGVLVNEFGQRFVTEDTYPGRVSQFIRYRADDKAWLIIDDAIYTNTELGPFSAGLSRTKPVAVGETAAEIEQEIGFPEGALAATLTLYNRHAERGRDPVFHKDPRFVTPLQPPYGVLNLSGRAVGFTLGGLRTSLDGQVMHVAGHPIAGLYAAGRIASGIPVWGYASGASLGDGSFFGRRAGRHAALRGM